MREIKKERMKERKKERKIEKEIIKKRRKEKRKKNAFLKELCDVCDIGPQCCRSEHTKSSGKTRTIRYCPGSKVIVTGSMLCDERKKERNRVTSVSLVRSGPGRKSRKEYSTM
jgi:hypothetical protein